MPDGLSEIALDESPRCGCREFCGDLPEQEDHPNAHCKGLKPQKNVSDQYAEDFLEAMQPQLGLKRC